jgi:ABC-2 type transport system permease protein
MLFLQQLRGELRKLFARPRTWMGYGAFLVMEAVILFVYKLDKPEIHARASSSATGWSSAPTTAR